MLDEGDAFLAVPAERAGRTAFGLTDFLRAYRGGSVTLHLTRMLNRDGGRHWERNRPVRKSHSETTIPVLLGERNQRTCDWITSDIPARGIAPNVQRRMPFQQL